MNSKSKIEFKLDTELFEKYKSYCDKNGYDMSKRLRLHILKEIEDEEVFTEIEIINLKHKPTTEIEVENIHGINFPKFINSSNVFIFETLFDIDVLNNIMFRLGNIIYKLKGIQCLKSENNIKLVQCKYWSEEYY